MRNQDRQTRPPLPPTLGHSDDVFGSSIHVGTAPPEDAIDLWGRRIGRGLAVTAAVVIIAMFLWPRIFAG